LGANLELIRQGYEDFNRTGRPDLSRFHPEAELDARGRVFDPAVYRGHEEIGRYFDQLDEFWERQALEPRDFVEVDDMVVVPRITTEDKVLRMQIFQTPAEAFEAAGLPRP
jgi:hypothetical protein